MESKHTIDFKAIPKGFLESIVYLSARASESVGLLTLEHIKKSSQHEDFENAYRYLDYCLSDSVRGDTTSESVIGIFPIVQAEIECKKSLDLLVCGFYRQAYDSCRRFLEFSLLQVYFSFDRERQAEAVKWYRSERDTPFFSGMTKLLLKNSGVSRAEEKIGIISSLKSSYGKFSDITHIKGNERAYQKFDQSSFTYDGYDVRGFRAERVDEYLEAFVTIISDVSCLYAVLNPILLKGLPLHNKFGLNPPAFGFFSDGQSEHLWDIIDKKYHNYLEEIVNTSEEVAGLDSWVNSLPDLTEDQIRVQDEEFEKMIAHYKR